MKSRLLTALGLALLVLAPAGGAIAAENNTDRPGSDYRRIRLNWAPGTIAGRYYVDKCRSRCQSDAACKAWTVVDPGAQDPKPVCYLKNAVPGKVPCSFCTSGLPDRGDPGKPPVVN